MLTLNATRRKIDLEQYKLRSAAHSDYEQLITESTHIYEDGKLMIAYLELDLDCADIVEALKRINFDMSSRTSGMISHSRILGYSPRNTLRKDFCSATKLASEQPEEHAIIAGYAESVCDHYYQQTNPELYAKHRVTTNEHVLGDYRIKQSVFTSGIINKNNPLKYHFDAGNFSDVWSCMLVFKNKVKGGYLSVPEYNVGFELKNNSLLMFDGQGLLHGVTPIQKQAPDAYRYSIVYYSLRQMWHCEPIDDEIIRIRKLKTQREVKRKGNSTGNAAR